MSFMVPVSKSDCQASFDNHFIKYLRVKSLTDSWLEVHSQVTLSEDPYLERHLGHYSSMLMLEIAKQISKASVLLNYEMYESTRFIVGKIEIELTNYLVLSEDHPVDVVSVSTYETHPKKNAANRGSTEVYFLQGDELSATIRMDTVTTSGAVEERMEKMVADKLNEKKGAADEAQSG